MKLIPKNNQLLVKSMERKEEGTITDTGLIIPEQTLEDDQVAQGKVIESAHPDYVTGDVVLFHKVIPVDVHLKVDKEIEEFWFVPANDIICIIKE